MHHQSTINARKLRVGITSTRRKAAIYGIYCLLIVLTISMLGCEYFPEATFELANESRLPQWFSLPIGSSRHDVSVTMSYYVKPWGRYASFKLHDAKGETLSELTGKAQGLTPLHLQENEASKSSRYPSFEVVTVDKVSEIIEHKRMEPIFYINDDPAVRERLTKDNKEAAK